MCVREMEGERRRIKGKKEKEDASELEPDQLEKDETLEML
jgi:hypothetical protein